MLLRANAQMEDDVQQTTLAITLERESEHPIVPPLGQRRKLVELMAAAIIAVYRASAVDAREEDGDDDARE